MRKEDMTVASYLLEAITIILGVAYIGLQLIYGIKYHIEPYRYLTNILAGILLYAVLTLLAHYPERVHRLPAEAFTPDIRRLTIWMLRWIKLVFIASLLGPCIFDVFGIQIRDTSCLFVIGLILLILVFYEYRIIRILKKRK